jgi:hypothetical protein
LFYGNGGTKFREKFAATSAKMSDIREAIKRLHGANCAESFGI